MRQEARLSILAHLALLAADQRVTAHLDRAAIEKLLDPTLYTGLCAQMAKDAAMRQRLSGDAICRLVRALGFAAGLARRQRAHGLRHQAITEALHAAGHRRSQ